MILFWSDSIVFKENSIASVIAELILTLGVNGPSDGESANQMATLYRVELLHYMQPDTDSHPNCQLREWDQNRNPDL